MASYAPRVTVHPDRYGANRSWQSPMVKWLILHTSEQSGAEDPDDAENLAAYMTTRGDRPSSNGGFYGASYHGVTDTDRIIPCTEDHLVAFAAGGANQYGLHLCLPVRIVPRSSTDRDANISRAEWLDAGSRPYIRQAAEWLVDKGREHDVPLRRLTPNQMRAGMSGYCDHWTASLAFGKSDHTDCGPHFPWDVLAADIADITTPAPPRPPVEEEIDMSKVNAVIIRVKGFADHFVAWPVSGDTKARLDPDEPTPVVLDGNRSEFSRRAGYRLTPMPGE